MDMVTLMFIVVIFTKHVNDFIAFCFNIFNSVSVHNNYSDAYFSIPVFFSNTRFISLNFIITFKNNYEIIKSIKYEFTSTIY